MRAIPKERMSHLAQLRKCRQAFPQYSWTVVLRGEMFHGKHPQGYAILHHYWYHNDSFWGWTLLGRNGGDERTFQACLQTMKKTQESIRGLAA